MVSDVLSLTADHLLSTSNTLNPVIHFFYPPRVANKSALFFFIHIRGTLNAEKFVFLFIVEKVDDELKNNSVFMS
jgi:hypothetical protein